MAAMTQAPNSHLRCIVAIGAVGGVLLLAACGSSGSPRGLGADSHALGITFATCMRDHAVSDFPDPEPDSGIQIPIELERDPSPVFTSALHDCEHLIPPGGGPPVASAGAKTAALAFARCVREHGVPDYPDPTYQDGHEIPPPLADPTLDLDSPAFAAAAKRCSSP